MKKVIEKVKLMDGKEITITSNQFTDEELAKMPENHRRAILSLRGFSTEMIKERYEISGVQ